MRRILYFAILLLALGACKRPSDTDSRPVLLVSIEPQRKILEELVGDNFRVVAILSNGANPETYEPSVAQRMLTADAKAYFRTGFLPFEGTIAASMKPDAPVVDTSTGITPVTGTHDHGSKEGRLPACDTHDSHAHADADPHMWTSIPNGKTIAANMLQALTSIDPANADAYAANYTALAARLDSLDASIARRLRDAGAHAFAVWHPSLSYFARDYGLHQISVGWESKEVSPATLRGVIDEARADSVSVFFFQKEFDSRQASTVNKEIGSRMVEINPLAYDWENELIIITNELTR